MYWTVNVNSDLYRKKRTAVAIGDTIFLFGGYHIGEDYNIIKKIDIHVLDTVTFNWWKIDINNKNIENVPFERFGYTAVANNSKIYIWGGINKVDTCSTLYCFDTETLKWSKPNVSGKIPMSRDGHSACVINNCMYIFGGFQVILNEYAHVIYMLNFSTMVWSIVKAKGDSPSCRDFHTATVFNHKMYIFGGLCHENTTRVNQKEIYSSSIYYLNTHTNTWTCPTVGGDIPIARRNHSAFVHNGFFYIFGGYNENLKLYFQDIIRYNPETSSWSTISPYGITPCARRIQVCLVIKDRIFISGGITSISRPMRDPFHTRQLDYGFERDINYLKNLDDLHVLNMNPSLKEICLVNLSRIIKNEQIRINDLCIPESIKTDLAGIYSIK